MKDLKEKFFEQTLLVCSLLSGAAVLFIFGFMLVLGRPLFREGHLFSLFLEPWQPHQGHYGILSMVLGSLIVSVTGLMISFPLSLGCACFIAELGPAGISRFLRKTVEMMTGVPTVVYGFTGIFLLVPFIREIFGSGGLSLFTASVMLALLIAPTMILFFTDAFSRVPKGYLHAVESMGGNKVQKLLFVILPNSLPGIAAGSTIALGRALGDTLIALMLAGNAVQMPGSLLDSGRTLTSHIGLVFAADYESLEFKAVFACGLTLYLMTTVLVLAARATGFHNRRTQ